MGAAKLHAYKGEMLTAKEIAEREGVKIGVIKHRIERTGSPEGKRLEYQTYAFQGEMLTANAISLRTGISHEKVLYRLRKGLPLEAEVGFALKRSREAFIDSDTPYEQDIRCQIAVELSAAKGGMTLEEVGDMMGMSRQAAEQFILRALAKLNRKLVGPKRSEFIELLRGMEEQANRQESHWEKAERFAPGDIDVHKYIVGKFNDKITMNPFQRARERAVKAAAGRTKRKEAA